jgi:ribosomal protein S19
MDYFLNVNLSVYNGLKFIEFEVKKEMLGSTVGTYILTRRITSEIHLKKKIKKKKN